VQDQVEVVGLVGQVDAVLRLAQSRDRTRGQADSRRRVTDVVRVPPIDVDPQQLVGLERTGKVGLELDLAVTPVSVVQSGAGSPRPAWLGRQRIEARSTATMIARNAIPYWSASIERSIRPGSSLLGTTSGRVEIGCSSIDRVDSCKVG
jgi:hypothetical protein